MSATLADETSLQKLLNCDATILHLTVEDTYVLSRARQILHAQADKALEDPIYFRLLADGVEAMTRVIDEECLRRTVSNWTQRHYRRRTERRTEATQGLRIPVTHQGESNGQANPAG